MPPYKVYLVGGAVRDKLLGLTVTDHDWVVTGATPDDLLNQGYQQVGKHFPVFLHPKTKEEFALARTEQKQGAGYTGFVCDFSPEISLEEDLARRDLTINAIAQSSEGYLIDPFHGQEDIQNRVLRHVSDAFIEDPLRILRVARFAARFKEFGFHVAPETMTFMQNISQSGELATLSSERIWKELEKALKTPNSDVFFDVLEKANALEKLFPELIWNNTPQQQSLLKNTTLSIPQRWAVLTQYTPLLQLKQLHRRLKSPNLFKQLAEQTRDFIENHHIPMSAQAWESWLTFVSAVKKPQPYKILIEVLAKLTQTEDSEWLTLRSAIAKVSSVDLIKQGINGAELGKALKKERIHSLEQHSSSLIKKE